MRAFGFSWAALSIAPLAALLAACGGGSSVPVAAGNAFAGATGPKHHQKFSFTGAEQTFVVPAGVTRLTVIARGGEGDGAFYHGAGHPGFPGRVYAVIRVHPGEKLYAFVAGSGRDGGFNGGGAGGIGSANFGGGASDVRVGGDGLKDRIVVAAGGGTAGNCALYCYANGGSGGGLNGEPGVGGGGAYGGGGGGGTQRAGGQGGAGGIGNKKSENGLPGGAGALGVGGNGGAGGQTVGSSAYPGAGGGGGYYGGGGGGGGASAGYSSLDLGSGGGGGGSSYVEPSAITSRMWTGWRAYGNGDGQIIFSWN
jgi:hypothetical protein